MTNKIIDKMIDEKVDCKMYREWAEELEDEELKEMLETIADQEHNHYKMLREWLNRYMKED